MYITSKMTSPVTKTAKPSKWFRLSVYERTLDRPSVDKLFSKY